MMRRLTRGIMLTRRAHTLTEMLIVSFMTVVLFTSTIGVFVVARTFYVRGMASQELQRDVNWLMARIVKGIEEGGVRYGLRSSESYTEPITPITEINFTGADGNARRYRLSSGSIVYESPTQTPNTRTIYTVPANSTLTLRFEKPTGYMDNETLAIYISITRQVSGRTASGSLTTYVNLRNVSK